ncbi:MAG: acyltransferase [Alphaproteobacteria bacterium]|nr:MAG: acyltransferase [Alphaproteobacteria bacterium]
MLKKIIRRFLVPRSAISLYYFVKYGAKISPHAEVELSPNLTFGPGCTVSSFTKMKASDGPLTIGARCGFATGCFISPGAKGIVIGDNLVCGPNSVITSSNYIYEKLDVHPEDQGHSSKGVRIGRNVWLGAGTIVLDGSVLGDNTIVVANSLINRRYPPNVILQGNPAKIIMRRDGGHDRGE